MRKTEIMDLLRDVDEETAVRLGEQYPGIPDAEQERIFRRIEENLKIQETTQQPMTIAQAPRFSWMRHAAAAACFLVLVGTFAGLTVLRTRMPAPEPPDATEPVGKEGTDASSPCISKAGERCKAANLTQSGSLWLTVMGSGMAGDGLFYVRLSVESESAVSRGQDAEIFMADNFMLAIGQNGTQWKTIQPCGITTESEQPHPYAFSLQSGETQELELFYPLDAPPDECMIVTSYCTDYPCIALKDKEK